MNFLKVSIASILFISIFNSQMVGAVIKTGSDVLMDCRGIVEKNEIEITDPKDEAATMKKYNCLSYMDAMMDGLEAGADAGYLAGLKAAGKSEEFVDKNVEVVYSAYPKYLGICMPTNTTRLESIRILFRYIESNPNTGQTPASLLYILSMQKAFPCEKM